MASKQISVDNPHLEPLDSVFKPFEIWGLKGMKRLTFRKSFYSEKAWERWLERNDETGDVEILSFSDLD